MTLMNVMLALAIAGMVLTPIFINQAGAMARVRDESTAVRRLFAAMQFLYDAQLARIQGKQPEPKSLTSPAMKLTFDEVDPTKKSALSSFGGIKIRSVAWSWKEGSALQKDQLMSLVYQPSHTKREA